jgi:hypothetical protein
VSVQFEILIGNQKRVWSLAVKVKNLKIQDGGQFNVLNQNNSSHEARCENVVTCF